MPASSFPSSSISSFTAAEDGLERPGKDLFQAPWVLFWVGFAVRVLYMTLAHTYRIRAYDDHFSFGWEMGRIARALNTGYGYADPFRGHTGPTAWTGPLYPLLLAGIFKVFGVYTAASAWVAIAINCAFSAMAARMTWEIAARCYGLRTAKWAGWLWALYPAAMQYAVRWVWEMNLTVLLFTWVLVLALRLRRIGEPEGGLRAHPVQAAAGSDWQLWALFGLGWGLLALSNPALVIFLPVCGLWLLLDGERGWQEKAGGVVLAGGLCVLCIAPWIGRNWLAFHEFVPLRGNFGAELYLGNGPGANGLLMEYNHPEQSAKQLRLYGQMGELAYARYRGALAKQVIRQDPGLFVRNTLKRLYFFWAGVPHPMDDGWYVEVGRNFNFDLISVAGLMGMGLALHRRRPAAGLFAMAFLLLPLLYYFVTVHARFRHPLEPLMTIFAVYLFQSAERKRKAPASH